MTVRVVTLSTQPLMLGVGTLLKPVPNKEAWPMKMLCAVVCACEQVLVIAVGVTMDKAAESAAALSSDALLRGGGKVEAEPSQKNDRDE